VNVDEEEEKGQEACFASFEENNIAQKSTEVLTFENNFEKSNSIDF